MKALTLTPPWGTLIAAGAKTIETRSWRTHHRGPLAIHQAKGLAGMRETDLAALCDSDPFFGALRPHLSGYTAKERARDLPRGGIVAVTVVLDCIPTEDVADRLGAEGLKAEEPFGDYTPGRWAWILGRTLNVHDPIECSGAMGLWTVPEEIRRELALITDMAWTADEDARFQKLINTPDVDRDVAIAAAIREAQDA